ncbi:MAG: DUF4956 domain-containing protein [Gemmataceae bacterium]
MPDWLTHGIHADIDTSWPELAVRLVAAFALGLLAALLYHLSTYSRERGVNWPFLATMVLLSLLIALVTIVIGNSVARAFSLVGTLSLVRFRTVVEDTRESAFVILAVGFGMSAGVGYVLAPLMVAPLVLLVGWCFRTPPVERQRSLQLLVRVASNSFSPEQIASLLSKHAKAARLAAITTARGGAALDATYEIQLASPSAILGLVDAVSRLEGVQNVEIRE